MSTLRQRIEADPRVKEVWDEGTGEHGDGVWVILRDGYRWDNCHAVHEHTWTAAFRALRQEVTSCTCPDCLNTNAAAKGETEVNRIDSLKLELRAEEHVRLKDNEYLLKKIAQRDKLLREWMSYARENLTPEGHLNSLLNRTKSAIES